MNKYVALLRGINVGGKNKVDMTTLRTCLEDLGYKNVQSYINSWNIIFETDENNVETLQGVIEKTIEDNFKLQIPVLVVHESTISALCKKVPKTWVHNKEYKTDVLLLWKEYTKKRHCIFGEIIERHVC